MRGDSESASKNTSNPIIKYQNYSNVRIFENSLASELVFVEGSALKPKLEAEAEFWSFSKNFDVKKSDFHLARKNRHGRRVHESSKWFGILSPGSCTLSKFATLCVSNMSSSSMLFNLNNYCQSFTHLCGSRYQIRDGLEIDPSLLEYGRFIQFLKWK